MQLSIIIPVYKVEDYIDKCLQSIVDGSRKSVGKFEVIIVDDGSPDRSGKIADSFAQKYSFMRVIHKQNAGVAAARNTGMEEACGEWLYFVDSDDWLGQNAVDIICERAKQTLDADILFFDAWQNVGEEEKPWNHFSKECVWEEKEDIRRLQRGMLYFPMVDKKLKVPLAAPWDKVYRRSFLAEKDICFQSGLKVLDDMVFNMEAFGAASRIVYYKDKIYHYRYVPDSITNQYKAKRLEQDCVVWKYLRSYMDSAWQQEDWSNQEKEAFLQAYYCRIVKSFSICTRLQFFHKNNPMGLSKQIQYVKKVLRSEPYYEAFNKARFRNAEWRLKVMLLVGRLRFGYGVYMLYIGQSCMGRK